MVDLVIISGVYGAGKTTALRAFEEAGYFITDNVPVKVVDSYFQEIAAHSKKYPKVALSVNLEYAKETYELAKKHKEFSVIFLGITCEKATLLERYHLSRKLHPKQPLGVPLEEAISSDIEHARSLTDLFDVFIDTSKLTKEEFRNRIYGGIIGLEKKFIVAFSSFGYKVSVPQDIETVFDVRLLPNPYWVPELRDKTGLDKEVKDFVLNAPQTKEYLNNVLKYLDFYLEELKKNGRNHASIAFACSGGQHRSVAIAEYVAARYSKKYHVSVTHKNLPGKK